MAPSRIWERVRVPLLFLLPAVAIFYPFLLQGKLPLWSTDNLFGSYPCIVNAMITFHDGFNAWFPYYLTGCDWSGSVNNMKYSLLLIPLYFLPQAWFWLGLGILQLIIFWALGYLSYRLMRHLVRNDGWAFVAAMVFQLCHWTLFLYQTFPNPLVAFCFIVSGLGVVCLERDSGRNGVLLLCGGLCGLMLCGHPVYAANYAFTLPILFFAVHSGTPLDLFRPGRPLFLFATSAVCALALTAFRWIPFLFSLGDSNRMNSDISHFFGSLVSHPDWILRWFVPEIWGVTLNETGGKLNSILNQHEAFHYYGTIGAFLLLIAFFIPRPRIGLYWKFVCFFYVASALRLSPFAGLFCFLSVYPFVHGSMLLPGAFFLCVLIGLCGKALTELSADAASPLDQDKAVQARSLLKRVAGVAFATVAVVAITCVLEWVSLFISLPRLLLSMKIGLSLPVVCYLLSLWVPEDSPWKTWLRRMVMAYCLLLFSGLVVAGVGSLGLRTGDPFLCLRWGKLLTICGLWLCLLYVLWPYRRSGFVAVAAGTAFVIAFCAVFYGHFKHMGNGLWVDGQRTIQDSAYHALIGVSQLVVSAGLLIGILILCAKGKIQPSRICVCVGLATFFEMLPAFYQTSFFVSKPFVPAVNGRLYPPVQDKQMDLKNYRVSFSRAAIQDTPKFKLYGGDMLHNISIALLLPTFGGVNSQLTKRDVCFFSAFGKATEIGITDENTNPRLLDIVGVRYDFSSGEMIVRDTALSRFMTYGRYESYSDPEKALQRLAEPSFNPLISVVLETSEEFSLDATATARPCAFSQRSTDVLSVDVSALGGRILLFNDSYHPDWHARVDGKPVPILRANYRFMAIPLPADAKTAVFSYMPKIFRLSLAVSFSGIPLFLLLVFVCCKRPVVRCLLRLV